MIMDNLNILKKYLNTVKLFFKADITNKSFCVKIQERC